MSIPTFSNVLTEKQAAEHIGMSRSFLAKSRMNGDRENHIIAPPYLKIGRAVRYRKEDLDNWLMQHRQTEGKDISNSVN